MTATLPMRIESLGCDEADALVSGLIDGELEPRQAMRVELHLAICPACARFARELAATVTALHALGARRMAVRLGRRRVSR